MEQKIIKENGTKKKLEKVIYIDQRNFIVATLYPLGRVPNFETGDMQSFASLVTPYVRTYGRRTLQAEPN